MVKEADAAVLKAETAKRDAIIKFNEKFGPYSKTYTGDKAKKEYERINNYFKDMKDLLSVFDAFNIF